MNYLGFAAALPLILPCICLAQDAWTQVPGGNEFALINIHCPSTLTCYGVGANGRIRKTTDGGSSWTSQTSNTTQALRGVYCPTTETCYITGNAGVVLKSSNGGAAWTLQTSGTTLRLNAVHCASPENCVIVGGNPNAATNETVMRLTTDGGGSWTTNSSGASDALMAVQFVTPDTVFAVGASGMIRRSVNRGIGTWTSRGTSGVSSVFHTVHFLNQNTGWAGGVGGIFKTTNSGLDWVLQSSCYARALRFVNVNTGYAICQNGDFSTYGIKTTDGGVNWVSAGLSHSNGLLYAMAFPDTTMGYAVGEFYSSPTGAVYRMTRPVSIARLPKDAGSAMRVKNTLLRRKGVILTNEDNSMFELRGRRFPPLIYPP